jgi:hypothetical protein
MPALNPEQRKRQQRLQQQREEEYNKSMAPRKGSKGYRSSTGGGTSKADTIGGATPSVKPRSPVKAKVSNISPKEGTGKGSPADKKPAGVKPAQVQPTTVTRPVVRVSSPAPAPAPKAPAPKAEAPKPNPNNKSTYRDAADTKGLSVGRYRTLAEHRAAVEKQNAKPESAAEPKPTTDSKAMQMSGTLKALGIASSNPVPDMNAKDAVTPPDKKKKKK